MATVKHVHSYVHFKARPGYLRCVLPDCTHFLIRENVVGKYSMCPDCGTKFIIDFQNIKRRRPRCLNCEDTARARAYRIGRDFTKDLQIFKEASDD